MTEREEFEAWVNCDLINNCHPMEAAWVAWQAARANISDLLQEVRGYLQCVIDQSMSRNNAENLASELIETIDAAIAKK